MKLEIFNKSFNFQHHHQNNVSINKNTHLVFAYPLLFMSQNYFMHQRSINIHIAEFIKMCLMFLTLRYFQIEYNVKRRFTRSSIKRWVQKKKLWIELKGFSTRLHSNKICTTFYFSKKKNIWKYFLNLEITDKIKESQCCDVSFCCLREYQGRRKTE